MKTLIALTVAVCLAISALVLQSSQNPPANYEQLKTQAEKYYSEGSFGLAHETYAKVGTAGPSPAETRWIAFRLADTTWRAQAATQTADTTQYDRAREQLEILIRDIQRVEDRDPLWVEVQGSLGDFWWTRRDSKDWNRAWSHYQQALDWWAGSPDLERARSRYLKIVWTIAKPANAEQYYYYGYYGNILPLETVENVLKIARSEEDKAHAHYLIAMTLRHQGGDWEQRQRVPQEFEAAIQPGKATDWYDDAMYQYAEWMANQGRAIPLSDGQWRSEPDYVKALELFRRLIREFRKGESRYYDQAEAQIKNITTPTLNVVVPHIFLPGSEIQFHLNWRNSNRIDFTLSPVDLTSDLRFSEKDTYSGSWLQAVTPRPNSRAKSWSKTVEDKRDYKPGQELVRLDGKLPAGAYLLEAKGQTTSARDLILVSEASLVLKTSSKQALAYFCDAINGAPIAQAKVKLWQGNYEGQKWAWRETIVETNQDGIAVFNLTGSPSNVQLFATALSGERQAFSFGQAYTQSSESQPWRIYAVTDRPAYRPNEKVQWKFMARRFDGAVYSTPAEQTIEYQITDSRGSKVMEGKAALNSFGSAWGSLELTEAMPLGEFHVIFWDQGRRNTIGNAVLFRLEEYKLPEFKVSIHTPEENGKKKAFRLGDKVEVNVQAEYYFGGPVANASVELIIRQNPFYHVWQRPYEYPWLYSDMSAATQRYWGGEGQVIKRETLKTDATGKATLTFETPRNSQQDYEYRIEARVVDSSRREILGNETVRVTRQLYYVYPRPQHNLYRPQDKVTVLIKALDANNQPVQTEGRVKVIRNHWYEIWLDPNNREVQGEELKALQKSARSFPPAAVANERSWQLKFRGYQQEEILSRAAKTSAEGEAEFSFTPEREGYYRVAWTSEVRNQNPIQAETSVWVAHNSSTELGYRHGGLEIILDQETFQSGKTAPVLLSVPTPDRYVLFTSETESLLSYQLVHVTGTIKLVELEIREKHVPNFFLSAAMVSDRQFFMDTKQVVVPPVKNFLKVDLSSDRSQYEPREEGTLTVVTRNHEGKPVSAEVALGLVDESVYYIQQDYAGDPRQFYFGSKRSHVIQTQSTLNVKSYLKLVEGSDKRLVDEREIGAKSKENVDGARGRPDSTGVGEALGENIVGGVMGGIANAPAPVSLMREQRFTSAQKSSAMNGREFDKLSKDLASVSEASTQESAVQVRSDFRSTVFWQPDVVTGADGKAMIKIKYPDSLTGWKAMARVASAGNQFGIGSVATKTQKPLIVRLQAPRFFLVGDRLTVSAVMNNNTDQPMTVTPSLSLEGLVVLQSALAAKGAASASNVSTASTPRPAIQIAAHGEARSDWTVLVQNAGSAKLTVTARAEHTADAMEKVFPIYEHGIDKFISKSGKMRGNEASIRLDIPKDRKVDSTALRIQVTPSLAVTMLDALPYLIDYPYGCTEQTLSRFLPAVITLKTLKDLGLRPEAIMNRLFGGIEQEHAGQTHSQGKKDLNRLDEMIQQGLDRLYGFQHSDGGWGWWKDGDSDHFMSAYVLWGLTLARDAGVAIRPEVLERVAGYLDKEIVEEELNSDQQAWMLHALSAYHASSKRQTLSGFQTKAFDNLWKNRQGLNAYSRALLALSAHHYGNTEKARTLIQNLENGVKRDPRPDSSILLSGEPSSNPSVMGTAHWGEDGLYWRWSEGGVEATSFALRALLAIDPKNALVEPVTHWLIRNRRGAQWSNTRDTAITVLALNEYLKQSGELSNSTEYELKVNGSLVATPKLGTADVLAAPSQFEIDRKLIRDGLNEIQITRKRGQGALYFSAQAHFFSLEEPIPPSGNEIFVRRQYYKLTNRPTLLKGFVTERLPLRDGDTIQSGERAEVVLTIESKNNYEYLLFEDLKPAGLEAVQVRSGEPLFAKELKSGIVQKASMAAKTASPPSENADYTNRSRWVYQELRDRKVALFIDKLPEGFWEIRYELRAEVPGDFHALPVVGHAMYVPEIRCNGEEQRIRVLDK